MSAYAKDFLALALYEKLEEMQVFFRFSKPILSQKNIFNVPPLIKGVRGILGYILSRPPINGRRTSGIITSHSAV